MTEREKLVDYSDLVKRLERWEERTYGQFGKQERVSEKTLEEAADAIRKMSAALSAMPDRQAGINEGLEMAAKVAEDNRTDDDSMWDRAAQTIASAISAMKVEK